MSRPQRELALLSTQSEMGGGEVMLLAMATAARDAGAQVRIVVPEGETAQAADRAGIPVDLVRAKDRRDHLAQLATWAAGTRRRDHLLWCNGLFPAVATIGHTGRVVHIHQEPQSTMQYRLMAPARLRAERTLVPSAALAAKVPGSTVMANWTAEIPYAPRENFGRPLRIGFIGRPSPVKGFDVLAHALALVDREQPGRVELVVAGEPRFVDAAEQTTVERALIPIESLVTRLGWVDRDRFFDRCDVVVVPSVWLEAFGLVTAEAMAAGRPLIVSDAGALPEVVGPDHPWIVPAGDVEALAAMIATVADSDPAPVVAAARQRWEAHYSPAAGARRFRAVLADLGVIEPEVEHA